MNTEVINEKLSNLSGVKDICNRVIKFINDHLIDTVVSNISQKNVLHQMYDDYHRCNTELGVD